MSEKSANWLEEELKDGDRICEAAGVQRTEGGRLPVGKIIAALRRTSAPRAEELLPFDQVRDAIVARMEGHTISLRDAPAWENFLGLLKLVKRSECALSPQHGPSDG